jgi:hypothetical protein
MLLHPLFADMFAKQAIVAFLQARHMIPDDTRNINLVMQAKITFGGIQTILIGFANLKYHSHCSDT